MLEFPRWKYALVLILSLVSVLYAVPNLFPQDPAVQISANRNSPLDAALQSRVEGVLEKAGIEPGRIGIEGKNLMVRLKTPEDQLLSADLIRGELKEGYNVALNLASTVPSWMEAVNATPMPLGLDLQGGVHFLMQVDEAAALDKRVNGFVDDIRALLRDNDIRYAVVDRSASGIRVELRDPADRERAAGLMGRDIPDLIVDDGADDKVLDARVRPESSKQILDNAIDQNLGTLRKRVNELGVTEPIVQRQGASRIVVQLAGVQDTAQAKKILGATATLEYRAVVGDSMSAAYDAMNTGRVPPDARLYYRRDRASDGSKIPVLLSKRVIASGDQLVNAQSGFAQEDGSPQVSVTLNNVGGQRMLDFTTENVGKPMAVVFIERTPETRVVDGKEVRSVRITEEVISVATVRGVFGKHFQTTGLDSTNEASELALLLRAGSLAAPVDIVEERVIGPSLGKENIEAGKRAIMLGFALVCALMIIYYRLMGVVAVFALFVNLLMLTALLSAFDATLTMPGIAGIVLTLGMAIDGNVLILERVREELRAGNTPINSIRSGYERAWTVILDSNVTKLIAAIALISFGSGPVKGFAVVLLCGVLTSVFTSVMVSRAVVSLIYGGRRKVERISV